MRKKIIEILYDIMRNRCNTPDFEIMNAEYCYVNWDIILTTSQVTSTNETDANIILKKPG